MERGTDFLFKQKNMVWKEKIKSMCCQIRQLLLKCGRNKPLVFVGSWPSVGLRLYFLRGHGVQSMDIDKVKQMVGSLQGEREISSCFWTSRKHRSFCFGIGHPTDLYEALTTCM